QPTSYNLARISAALAKANPGFNMTLWTAPRAQFEAAIGLTPSRVDVAPDAGVGTPSIAPRSLPSRLGGKVAIAGAVLLLLLGQERKGRYRRDRAQASCARGGGRQCPAARPAHSDRGSAHRCEERFPPLVGKLRSRSSRYPGGAGRDRARHCAGADEEAVAIPGEPHRVCRAAPD